MLTDGTFNSAQEGRECGVTMVAITAEVATAMEVTSRTTVVRINQLLLFLLSDCHIRKLVLCSFEERCRTALFATKLLVLLNSFVRLLLSALMLFKKVVK